MDNFFTMTKTFIGTCECDVAAMGIARARTGWPPKQLGKRSIQDTVLFAKKVNHIRGMNRAV